MQINTPHSTVQSNSVLPAKPRAQETDFPKVEPGSVRERTSAPKETINVELKAEQQVQAMERQAESTSVKRLNPGDRQSNPVISQYLDNQNAEKNLSDKLVGIDVFV